MKVGNGVMWHGDCLEMMRHIPDGSVDCVVTDPPYRVISGGITACESNKNYGLKNSVLYKNDSKIFDHNDIEIHQYLPIFFKLLKFGSHCYIMTNNINLRELLNQAVNVGFSFHNLLVWDKHSATPNRWYMKNLEYVILLYKKPAKKINNAGSKQLFKFDNPRNKIHPTEKPVELMQHYIENSSQIGDLILDPFSGSGTTAIAAQASGRRFICIEKDPIYYYQSCGRIWKACQENTI